MSAPSTSLVTQKKAKAPNFLAHTSFGLKNSIALMTKINGLLETTIHFMAVKSI